MNFLLLSSTKPHMVTKDADYAYTKFLTDIEYTAIASQIENYPQGVQMHRFVNEDGEFELVSGDISMASIGSIDIILAKAEYGENNTPVSLDIDYLYELYAVLNTDRSAETYADCRAKLFAHVKQHIEDRKAIDSLLSTI